MNRYLPLSFATLIVGLMAAHPSFAYDRTDHASNAKTMSSVALLSEDGDNGDKDHGDKDRGDRDGHKKKKAMRIDCRYHNVEKIHGIDHCYASAVYQVGEGDSYYNVQLGVGCDSQTIYNDKGRIQSETVGERFSPPTAAFPAVEVFPEDSIKNTGTYESILDIRKGRLAGTCYVHEVKYDFDRPWENEDGGDWDSDEKK